MAGGDSYKEFDNASIVTNTTNDTVKFGKFRLRKRDLVFGGIALFALLLVLILAIVLAVEVGRGDGDDNKDSKDTASDSATAAAAAAAATAAAGGSTSGSTFSVDDLCITPPCLRTAHYQKSSMDEMFEPCQDFYSYACGHFDENNPQTYMLSDVNPTSQIRLENFVKMLDLLTVPVDRRTEHSFERKLKHFVSSCNNHFDKMELRGRPMVEQVLRPYGKIFFLDDDFDPSEFDLQATLHKTHVDFWTAAFFTMNVVTDQENWNQKVVELNYGGLGMRYQLYIHSVYSSQALAIYREYMAHVLSLVSLDAGVDPNITKIQTFVDDVVQLETTIALATDVTPEHTDPHLEVNKLSLGQLTGLLNDTIDFVSYMRYAFNEYPNLFTEDTTVSVRREGYFHALGPIIAYMQTSDEGRRRLSNYLVWTLINRYSHDLSWEYIHAKRKLDNFLYGQKDDSSGARYCFQVARLSMADAMDAVFIKNFVKNENKAEAENILKSVRTELLKDIDSLQWMTEETRRTAHKKIEDSLYKIGYADYMVDDDLMDEMYYQARIDESDYFGNMLAFNKLHRATYNRRIGEPSSRTLWSYHIFDPIVEYWNPWHELIATAAVFQNPMFSHNGPAFYNFGSVGSNIAKHLIHAVDEVGNTYRLDGQHRGNWWSRETTDHYQNIKQCAVDAQKATELGPFNINGLVITPNISLLASDYVPELLADASGLRLAYKAYKSNQNQVGKEKMPAGFPGLNTEQLFFLAYAQANCQNTPDSVKFFQLGGNRYPGKARVNLAVSQVPEFAEVFQCNRGQPMYPRTQCTLF